MTRQQYEAQADLHSDDDEYLIWPLDEFGNPDDEPFAVAVGRAAAESIAVALNGCPAIGPSRQECIGRGEWHEVHSDGIGTTWRDWAGREAGIPAGNQRGSSSGAGGASW